MIWAGVANLVTKHSLSAYEAGQAVDVHVALHKGIIPGSVVSETSLFPMSKSAYDRKSMLRLHREETAAHKRKRGPDTPESLYTPSASTRHVRVASSRGTNPKTLGTNVNMAIAMVLNDFDNADADYGWTYRYTVLYDNSMLTIPSNREIAKAAAGTGDIPIEVVFGRTLIELREGLASNYETGEDNLPQVDSTEGVPPPYESVLEVGKFEEEEVEEDEADVVSPAQSAFKEHEAVKEGIRASINAVFEENMDYFLSQVSAKKASRNERARRGVS